VAEIDRSSPQKTRIEISDGALIPEKEQRATFTAWRISFFGAIALLVLLPFISPEPYRSIIVFLPDGILQTFKVTVLSIIFSLILGLFTGLGRISRIKIINRIATVYVEVIRGIPLLVQLFYIYYALGKIVQVPRLVAAVGVDSLMIVDTPDALLVAHQDRVQDVKKAAQQLKLAQHPTHLLHRTVVRPWGTYTVLEEGQGFKIKRIVVKPGASLSLQMHYHRSEHWIVVSGTAMVVNGEQESLVRTNESTFIPAGHKHRLENPGRVDLVMIEVQSGSYLGEDDIVRFEDKYGRG